MSSVMLAAMPQPLRLLRGLPLAVRLCLPDGVALQRLVSARKPGWDAGPSSGNGHKRLLTAQQQAVWQQLLGPGAGPAASCNHHRALSQRPAKSGRLFCVSGCCLET